MLADDDLRGPARNKGVFQQIAQRSLTYPQVSGGFSQRETGAFMALIRTHRTKSFQEVMGKRATPEVVESPGARPRR